MKKKRLSPDDQRALRALTERLLTIVQFIEDTQASVFAPQVRKIVESLAAEGELRRMRIVARDIDAMTLALAPHQREGLEAILQHRLGIDKEAERAEMNRLAAVAIKRGRVASEKERRRLERYVEMLQAIGGDSAELEAVEKLLNNG